MTSSRSLAIAALSLVALLATPSIASAQGLPEGGTVADGVDATNSTTGTVDDTTGTVDDTVDDTTGTVNDSVDDTTDAVNGAVDGATDTVDDTTGGASSPATGTVDDTVNDTTGTVNGAVDDATGGAGSVTDKVTDTVRDGTGSGDSDDPSGSDGVSDVVDSLLGKTDAAGEPTVADLTPDLVRDLVNQAGSAGMSPTAAQGWIDGKTVVGSTAFEDPVVALQSLSSLTTDLAASLAARIGENSDGLALVAPNTSFLDAAGQAALTAARALAFPLALALAVVGFLVVQGRIGRKDPKLALAPVDADQDSLSFE